VSAAFVPLSPIRARTATPIGCPWLGELAGQLCANQTPERSGPPGPQAQTRQGAGAGTAIDTRSATRAVDSVETSVHVPRHPAAAAARARHPHDRRPRGDRLGFTASTVSNALHLPPRFSLGSRHTRRLDFIGRLQWLLSGRERGPPQHKRTRDFCQQYRDRRHGQLPHEAVAQHTRIGIEPGAALLGRSCTRLRRALAAYLRL
jgi:hypothetical protein